MHFTKNFTPLQALEKAKHYCSYQERCHSEVKEKLYSFGLKKHEVDLLISELIQADFLNEERFAIQFSGGKFRLKQWGKIKIAYELKQKQVSTYNINKALESIEEDVYQKTLLKLTKAKWASLKNDQYMVREIKTIRYLQQKGYELPLIKNCIATIRKKEV
jgi:regulatory protein